MDNSVVVPVTRSKEGGDNGKLGAKVVIKVFSSLTVSA